MSGAYEEEEGDIAEAAAIEDWNLPPHVFEGEDGEEAPAQETRDPDPVQDDDVVLEIQELKRKNVALLGELEEKERTIEELRKQKAEQEAAYSGLKDDLEEAVEGQKIAQNTYTQKEQEAEATKRELESAKQEAESAKKEAENTAKEAEAKCKTVEEAARDQAEAAQKRMEELQSSFQAKQEAFELEVADLKKSFVELQDRHKNQVATIAKKSDELKAANRQIAEERKSHDDELTLRATRLLAEEAKFLAQQEKMKSEHAKEKEQMVNDHQEEVSKVSADLRAAREAG
ncbi:ACAD11 [Symbiodinium necroappetens]|uniref:ACAD11 protein n=1 Tax=Symbiodinium necroappetens TaxID=1628268 RepID=A0A813AYU4_9DINO|nr:ACAD11 [Symbiodinium necroappetens]